MHPQVRGLAVVVVCAAVPCLLAGPGGAAPPPAVRADVNCDGYGDAVIGAPGHRGARGAFHVLYGAGDGLHADGAGALPQDQLLTPSSHGVPGGAAAGNRFGATLTTGHFDGDRCADVAVLAPGDAGGRGALIVLYGSPSGVRGTGAKRFVPDVTGVPHGDPRAMAVGDFDGDGRDDLAVGYRGDAVTLHGSEEGSVTVYMNGPAGLGSGGAYKLHAGSPGLAGATEDGDSLGTAMAAGDFDGDGADDLAIGVPGETPGDAGGADARAGAVVVLPGTRGEPLGSAPARTVDQGTRGVGGTSEFLDHFGMALAAGDITGDGRDDLAVGVMGEDHFAGSVAVLHGSPRGLTGSGSQRWSPSSPGVRGVAQERGFFGIALSLGRFDTDRYADLAVGWDHPFAGGARSGAVLVLRGSARGLTSRGAEFVTQRSASHDGKALPNAHFGWTLAALSAPGRPDRLLVGGDDTPERAKARAGAVWDVYGKRRWTADSPGVKGSAAANAHFGQALG